MNYLLFILKIAFFDFSRNKMRTFLTSLGILIGVASVVILLAFGLGLKEYIRQQFESMGSNLIYILPGNMLAGGGMRGGGGMVGGIRFDDKDVNNLKRIKKASYIAPAFSKTSKIQGTKDSQYYEIAASTADIFPILNLEIDKGVAFTKGDVDSSSKKVVLGPKVAEKLFGSVDEALGKIVKIENRSYKVIGIVKSKGGGGLGQPSVDEHVYMPYKSALSFNPDKKYLAIYLKAKEKDDVGLIKEEAKKILLRRYKEDEFSVAEQKEIMSIIDSIFGVLNMVLVGIGAISLLVGGIGIMNIMYVSVTERIREIGIRRAVGAMEHDILYLFLGEAVILSLFGGLCGLIFAEIVVLLIRSYFPAYINITSVMIALVVSSTIGIVFGVFPAKKAADLSPIDAIRYE